jgi:Iap family predicted aminopeptidase
VFDSGSDKPATLIQQEAGRDANVIVGTGNTSNQGDTAPPPVPVPES